MANDNTPEAWYKNLPILTKVWFTAAVAVTVLMTVGVLNPMVILLHWPTIWSKLQVWRLFTNVFFFGEFGMAWVMQMYLLTSFSTKLEKNEVFATIPGSYLMFLLWQTLVLAVLSVALSYPDGYPALGQVLVFTVIYYWSRREPDAQLSFFGFVVTGAQFPFVMIVMGVLMGGDIFSDLLGVVSGHLYYFIAEVVPIEYGRTLISVPAFLQNFATNYLGAVKPRSDMPGAETRRNFVGGGQRLGGQ